MNPNNWKCGEATIVGWEGAIMGVSHFMKKAGNALEGTYLLEGMVVGGILLGSGGFVMLGLGGLLLEFGLRTAGEIGETGITKRLAKRRNAVSQDNVISKESAFNR